MTEQSGQRVLVAYGSRHGSTAEIAEWIAGALRERGLKADAVAAADVRGLDAYDAVVLGAAVYAGRWHRDSVRFTRRYGRELRTLPLWLFSSGPLDDSAAEKAVPAPPFATRIADRLSAQDHVTFGGRLSGDADGFIARRLVMSGHGGDFRDWARIRTWAYGIAGKLSAESRGTP